MIPKNSEKCEHIWFKMDGWRHWECEKCGARQTEKQHREEQRQQLIKLNKQFREWGYKGKPIFLR